MNQLTVFQQLAIWISVIFFASLIENVQNVLFQHISFALGLYFIITMFGVYCFLAVHILIASKWKFGFQVFAKRNFFLLPLFSGIFLLCVIKKCLPAENYFIVIKCLLFLLMCNVLVFLMLKSKEKQKTWSALYILSLNIGLIFFSKDLFKIADIDFHSTLTPWFLLVCGVLNALAFYAIWTFKNENQGLPIFKGKLTDTGRFLFTFSCIWMYFWYSQFMLIWYGNIPKELEYFHFQLIRNPFVFYLNLILNFGIPFLFLLSRWQKGKKNLLFISATSILAGEWINTILMFIPGENISSYFFVLPVPGCLVAYSIFRKKLKLALVVPLFILIFSSCSHNRNHPGFVYFSEMDRASSVQANTFYPLFADSTSMRPPVSGTVPREFIPYQLKKRSKDKLKAAYNKNPLKDSPDNREAGKQVFLEYCAQCHGRKGDGLGHLYLNNLYAYKPANLVGAKVQAQSEGEVFHSISVGYNLMKAHRPILTPEERWQIVLFIQNTL